VTQPPEPPPGTPSDHAHAHAVGPLALEAALLLDVVADRLESMKSVPPAAEPSGDGSGDAEPSDAPTTGAAARCPECGSVPGASCTACPLCRFMALLRGERPEATARLVDGALMIIRTLRSLVPDPPDPSAPPTAGAGSPHQGQQHSGQPAQNQRPGRHGGLEHIDIL